MRNNYFKVITIIISFFIIGFIREDIFVNINYILYFIESGQDPTYFYSDSIYKIIAPFSFKILYSAKWVLTLLFSVFYVLLAGYYNHWLFERKIYKELFVILFLFIITAGILMFVGYLKSDYSLAYKIARFLMGITQSPLLFIISAPFVWSQSQSNKKES